MIKANLQVRIFCLYKLVLNKIISIKTAYINYVQTNKINLGLIYPNSFKTAMYQISSNYDQNCDV